MLHKISKKSLDDYVLDAKETMQKIQQFQQKRAWPFHALLDGLKSLRHISKFSLDHCRLNAKGTMPKYPTFFLQYFLSEKWA